MHLYGSSAGTVCGRYRRTAERATAGARRGLSLGSARAEGTWSWVAPAPAPRQATDGRVAAGPAPAPAGATMVRIPDVLIHLMAREARDGGRSESEVWAEAAREWLRRRGAGHEPQPPDPPAAALPMPRASRSWEAIDALLCELRVAPAPAASGVAEPAA